MRGHINKTVTFGGAATDLAIVGGQGSPLSSSGGEAKRTSPSVRFLTVWFLLVVCLLGWFLFVVSVCLATLLVSRS